MTSIAVPMISVMRFGTVLRMAGPVENTASLRPASDVSSQCARYASHTSTAPMNAPTNWPTMSVPTSPQATEPWYASAIVTAGLRCATPPVTATLERMPMRTAMAHANVMTIQPALWAFDLFRSTPATTPSPSRIRTAVPMTSPMNMQFHLPGRPDGRLGR